MTGAMSGLWGTGFDCEELLHGFLWVTSTNSSQIVEKSVEEKLVMEALA